MSNTQTQTPATNESNGVDIAGVIIAFLLSPVVMMIALALALLAQGKHTADVFTYWSHVNTPWWLAYAFAAGVEVAVFLFVLHGHTGRSYLFALAAFATNVVYYAIGGANLLSAELLPVLLLSVLLPGVIVGYSHTIAEKPLQAAASAAAKPVKASAPVRWQFWRKPAESAPTPNDTIIAPQTPVALPVGTLGHSSDTQPPAEKPAQTAKRAPSAKPAKRAVGKTNEYGMTDAALAAMIGVQRQAIGAMRQRGTLTTRVAKELPHLELHTNGYNHE